MLKIRIKELEYDFGADNFCMQDFYSTEAALRTVMISYNVMALFKLVAVQSKANQRVTTIRLKCFSIGSWIVKSGRNEVLNMSGWMGYSSIRPILNGARSNPIEILKVK